MEYLKIWLIFIAFLSIIGTIVGSIDPNQIKFYQFPGNPAEVTAFAGRLFGAWTFLACIVRLICAFHLNEKGIYLATQCTFIIALIFYGFEILFSGNTTIDRAITPLIIASTSTIWMFVSKSHYVGKKHIK